MRTLIFIALFATAFHGYSQTAVLQDSTTQALDAEVWRPFVQAFNARNAEAFLALHARSTIRWSLGWGGPQPSDSVRAQAMRNWSRPLLNEERLIDLWFTHRSHTTDFAYDIGYYRVMMVPSEGIPKEFYGHFTTILGREDGHWKIFLDADNGAGVGREDLLKGVPLRKD